MENQWITKANVQQRAGRAGRVRPGQSYHLFTQEKYEEMERFPVAEILRIPLEKVIIDIKVILSMLAECQGFIELTESIIKGLR